MDPLTAFSTAGTVIQIVDFCQNILSSVHTLYDSTIETLPTNEEFERAASTISKLTQRIRQSLYSDTSTCITQEAANLQAISLECDNVAQDMLKRVESLKMTPGKDIWKAYKYALKTFWAKKDMETLNSKLEKLRDNLELTVLVDLRDQFNSASLQQSQRFDNLDLQSQHILAAMLNMKNAIRKDLCDQTLAVSLMLYKVEALVNTQHEATHTESVIRDKRSFPGIIHESIFRDFSTNISSSTRSKGNIKATIEKGILDDELGFAGMNDRHEQIAEAHQSTFQWLFPNDVDETTKMVWDPFPEWLRDGNALYWVNGKAGSGKSTLMRHIYHHPSTRQNLELWAKDKTLLMAGFFFWNSGMPEQRSQVGLLRTLLHEILSNNRDLIPVVLPAMWARKFSHALDPSIKYPVESISIEVLTQAFKNLVQHSTSQNKMCLFIDGLDEYEGSYSKIADLFSNLAESPNVKVCLSSRPLLIFEESFSSFPSLRLQDLTLEDIRSYVSANLNSDKRYQRLSFMEPILAPQLVEEIVAKADGVFLWVRLVVESLLSGLEYRDGIEDLQKRLRYLPTDLEKVYEHMLMTRIDPFYMTSASKMFQIVREAGKIQSDTPLAVLAFAFADEFSAGWPVKSLHSPLNDEDQRRYCQIMADRMKARCAGLLEVSRVGGSHLHPLDPDYSFGGKVQYLHRTVRDYLEKPKTAPDPVNIDLLRQIAIAGLRYASRVKVDASLSSVPLLEKLSQVMDYHAANIRPNQAGLWATQTFSPSYWQDSFLMLTIQYDLRTFVDRTLSVNSALINKVGRPLLHYALGEDRFPGYGDRNFNTVASKDMVEILLRHGDDLSMVFNGVTAWEIVLGSTHYRHTEANFLNEQLEIIRLFLQYGASRDETYCDNMGQVYSAKQIIRTALKIYTPSYAKEIESMLKNPSMPEEKAKIFEKKQNEERAPEEKNNKKGGKDNGKSNISISRRFRYWFKTWKK